MSLLSPDALRTALLDLPGWTCDGRRLSRTYSCASFTDAMAFVNRLADYADAADHHPDMRIAYRTVDVTWWTHEAGGITGKDIDGARATDDMAART